MKNKFKAEGSLTTHVTFGGNVSFDVNSRVKLYILEEDGSSINKNFVLEGTCEDVDVYNYIRETVNNFCSLLSLITNAPVGQPVFSSSSVQDADTTTVTTNKSLEMSYSIQGRASIAAPCGEEERKSLEGILSKYKSTPPAITLFRKALSEDSNYAKFWHFYNILQILIDGGDRAQIDRHLKTQYPNIKTLHSDFEKRDVTITVAIRDSFSHPSTYNGVPLDLDKELSIHINNLGKMTKDILMKKYFP